MPLLVVGSVAFDTITTPFGSAENELGGAATYSCLAASFFAQPQMVAIVGEDFGSEHVELFKSKNIDVTGLTITPGKTFRWGGKYSFDLNSRDTLFTELNVLETFNPLLPESYQNTEYVFLGNMHPKVQSDVLMQTKNPKFIGLDTMNYWIESTPAPLLEVLRLVDCLIINDAEARQLTEEHNLFKAAKKILELMKGDRGNNPLLVIKRGEFGLLMFQNEEYFNLPAYPLEDVLDPTGAGDTFAGGFMGYLAQNGDLSWENLKRACVTGSVLASFCVEKMGTERLLEVKPEDITERMQTFKRLTHFEIE